MAFHTSGDAGGVHCFGGAGPRPPFIGPRSSAHRFGFSLTRLNYVCLASRWFRSSCMFAVLYDFITINLHPKEKKGQVMALPNGSVSMACVTTFSPGAHYMESGRSCNSFYLDHTTYSCYSVLGSSISSRSAFFKSLDIGFKPRPPEPFYVGTYNIWRCGQSPNETNATPSSYHPYII